MNSDRYEEITIDPSTEEANGVISYPDKNNVSYLCEDGDTECQQPKVAATTTELPVTVPEGQSLETNLDTVASMIESDDFLTQLNLQQNWSMYLSFGSIILAVIIFTTLIIRDRKKRQA